MKNNYRKLKWRILLQAIIATMLTVLVGKFVLEHFLEDSSNELVRILTSVHISEEMAKAWYWNFIGNNKEIVILIGFLALFSIFFYIALAKLEDYLRQIESGINNITSEADESIRMIEELRPIEKRLTQIKNTLKKRSQEAIEAEQKKNDLVVYLAHDLKTPLTSVVAYLTMLDSYKDMPEAERGKYIHIAMEKAMRLGELTDEFFDLIKLNLQDMKLEKQNIHLTMMLEQLADEFYGVFREKGLCCDLQVEEELYVDGDPDKLARVFDNILRNATVYGYRDTSVRIEARKGEGGIQVCFSNQGDKIPEEKLQTIFEKFYRLDEARRSKTGGAGLGLAIAKKIIEIHGGTIRAISDEKETQFIATLPYIEKASDE